MSKFYKILPENLVCKAFQYHEGLNIDTNRIDKYKCGYGLHFSDLKHILSFCNYGSIIAEVEIPEDAVVKHFNNQSKADRIILKNLRPLWNVDVIEDLIQEGVDFETNKNLVLCEAAERGDMDIVKYAIGQGANVHTGGFFAVSETPLWNAFSEDHINIARYLVEHGANLDVIKDSALSVAAMNGFLDIVKYLIEHGASIYGNGADPLLAAVREGHLEIVKYLVEQGANIHASDDGALCWACDFGYLEIVKFLIEQGTDCYTYDKKFIAGAAFNGHLDVVKYLAEHGARKYCDFALISTRDPEIKSYLRSQILGTQE